METNQTYTQGLKEGQKKKEEKEIKGAESKTATALGVQECCAGTGCTKIYVKLSDRCCLSRHGLKAFRRFHKRVF
jgi:hypothetical protein